MPTLEERVAYLEGQVSEQSHGQPANPKRCATQCNEGRRHGFPDSRRQLGKLAVGRRRQDHPVARLAYLRRGTDFRTGGFAAGRVRPELCGGRCERGRPVEVLSAGASVSRCPRPCRFSTASSGTVPCISASRKATAAPAASVASSSASRRRRSSVDTIAATGRPCRCTTMRSPRYSARRSKSENRFFASATVKWSIRPS